MSTEQALRFELDHEHGAHTAGELICPSCQAVDLQAKARAQRLVLAEKLETRATWCAEEAGNVLREMAKELREGT